MSHHHIMLTVSEISRKSLIVLNNKLNVITVSYKYDNKKINLNRFQLICICISVLIVLPNTAIAATLKRPY